MKVCVCNKIDDVSNMIYVSGYYICNECYGNWKKWFKMLLDLMVEMKIDNDL